MQGKGTVLVLIVSLEGFVFDGILKTSVIITSSSPSPAKARIDIERTRPERGVQIAEREASGECERLELQPPVPVSARKVGAKRGVEAWGGVWYEGGGRLRVGRVG